MLSLFDNFQQMITRFTTANEQTFVDIDATPSEHVIIDLTQVLALLDSGEDFEGHRHLPDDIPTYQGPSLFRQILDDFKYAGMRGPHPSERIENSRAIPRRHP